MGKQDAKIKLTFLSSVQINSFHKSIPMEITIVSSSHKTLSSNITKRVGNTFISDMAALEQSAKTD